MIISVPHTGTRTLAQVLGETSFHHFLQNERDFEGKHDHVDFPIREPLATTLSWRSYQSDRTDMGEFRRWEAAIAYLSKHPHTIHKIEQHPVLDGQSGNDTWWKVAYRDRDIEALKQLPEVEYLLEWFERPEICGFFEQHYCPEELWWRSTESRNN